MISKLKKFWHNIKIDLGITKPKRVGYRFASWLVADALIRKGWTIAKAEEDKNNLMYWVCLELLEHPVKIK